MLCVPAVIEAMYKRIWSAAKKNGIDQKLKKGIKLSNSLRKVNLDMRRKIFKQIHDNFGGHFRMFVVGAAAPNQMCIRDRRYTTFRFCRFRPRDAPERINLYFHREMCIRDRDNSGA